MGRPTNDAYALPEGAPSGLRSDLFQWGWLLFFAGIPFLDASLLGLILVLTHWALDRAPRAMAKPQPRAIESSPPALYRIAVLGLIASYFLGAATAVSAWEAAGTGVAFAVTLLFGMRYAYRLELEAPGWYLCYLWVIPLSASAHAVWGLYEYSEWGGRAQGLVGNPNALSSVLLVAGFLGVAVLTAYRDGRRWLTVPYAGLIVTALLVTESRAAWLAVLAGILVFGLLSAMRLYRADRFRALRVAAAGLLACIVLAASLYGLAGPGLQGRMRTIFSLEANRDRVVLYQTVWRIIEAYPVLGVGLNNLKHHYSDYLVEPQDETHGTAHNYFLQALVETGVLGTVFLILLWVAWLARGFPARAASTHVLILYCLLVALLVREQFDTTLDGLTLAFVLNWLGGTLVGATQRGLAAPR